MGRTTVVIPARAGSTRFPNKPLAQLCGRSLIERTWRIARAAAGVDRVVVATDSAEIAQHVRRLGGEAMDVGPADNGTHRAALVAEVLRPRPDIVVNLQGDAALTPPEAVSAAVQALQAPGVVASTVGLPLNGPQYTRYLAHKARGRASGTTVVCDLRGDALYFSKAILPHLRHAPAQGPSALRHLGLYAFAADALALYATLPATPLEHIEGLEQLRWLEHGQRMRVALLRGISRTVWSIDYPEDLAVAAAIIEQEGELACMS